MTEIKHSKFRLASILYAENNYDVTMNTLIRKIVETVFLIEENKRFSVYEIIDKCKEHFGLEFSPDDLSNSIKKSDHFYYEEKRDEFNASLKESRYFACLSGLHRFDDFLGTYEY